MLHLHWEEAETQPSGTQRPDCKSCTDTQDSWGADIFPQNLFVHLSQPVAWMLPVYVMP